MERVAIPEKDLAHRGRIAGETNGDTPAPDGEPIAVAPCASVKKPKRIAHEVESREEARTGRENRSSHEERDCSGTHRGFHTSLGRGDPCTQ